LVALIEQNIEGWQIPLNNPQHLAERQALADAQQATVYPHETAKL
jgi:ferrochelatase